MSHANGLVKFKDGTILHYEYDGTMDICEPRLYISYERMRENWRKSIKNDENLICNHELEDVEIYTDYADGSFWPGTACRRCMMLITGKDPHNLKDKEGNYIDYTDGTPDWAEAGSED